jgi:hypothetical protein
VHRPDALLGAQPRDPVLTRFDAVGGQLISDEPVPDRRVIMVDIDGGVDQVGVIPVALGHRAAAPGIESLLGKSQHPAGHRDRDTIRGKVKDQRDLILG